MKKSGWLLGSLSLIGGLVAWRQTARKHQPRWEDLRDYYQHAYNEADTDLEAFARVAEYVAGRCQGDYDRFMLDMNYIMLNAPANWAALFAAPLERAYHYALIKLKLPRGQASWGRFKSSGFAFDDKSNQPQHFWYALAITYSWSAWLAEAQAVYHEWNAPGLLNYLPGTGHGKGDPEDVELSRQGIALGKLLKARQIPLNEVGAWLRRELG